MVKKCDITGCKSKSKRILSYDSKYNRQYCLTTVRKMKLSRGFQLSYSLRIHLKNVGEEAYPFSNIKIKPNSVICEHHWPVKNRKKMYYGKVRPFCLEKCVGSRTHSIYFNRSSCQEVCSTSKWWTGFVSRKWQGFLFRSLSKADSQYPSISYSNCYFHIWICDHFSSINFVFQRCSSFSCENIIMMI